MGKVSSHFFFFLKYLRLFCHVIRSTLNFPFRSFDIFATKYNNHKTIYIIIYIIIIIYINIMYMCVYNNMYILMLKCYVYSTVITS